MSEKYGLLVNPDTKLHRGYFNEMVTLLGIKAIYRYPTQSDKYTQYGEFDISKYSAPIEVGCIFADHEDQKTAKKLGWIAELSEKAALIHVPYDLQNLQVGCLFEIPSGLDNTPNRMFRVTKMSAIMIYPASITCEIVPEYVDTQPKNETIDFRKEDFNLLYEGGKNETYLR